jgi:hypothetical protein
MHSPREIEIARPANGKQRHIPTKTGRLIAEKRAVTMKDEGLR